MKSVAEERPACTSTMPPPSGDRSSGLEGVALDLLDALEGIEDDMETCEFALQAYGDDVAHVGRSLYRVRQRLLAVRKQLDAARAVNR